MSSAQSEHHLKMKQFLESEFNWRFSAGECNFLMQVLAYIIQDNPEFVPGKEGKKERLNYQSIRSIVLLNDKLSGQLQQQAAQASVILGDVQSGPETVQ
jgi:hypothetical protein